MTGVPDIWSRIASAGHLTVLLDYDGTLAPFNEDRFAAVPLPDVVDPLVRLERDPNTMVAVVSGRPAAEVQSLLGTDNLIIVGTHGFEIYRPGQGVSVRQISDEQRNALDHAEMRGVEAAGRERTERKSATVAVHVRGLSDDAAATLLATLDKQWRRHLDPTTLELRYFDGGIELRALGRHKGDAVRELAQNSPPDSLVMYIGDDDTDEDAFRALLETGIGIKVGPEDVPTAAQGRLPSCEAVRQFIWTLTETRTRT